MKTLIVLSGHSGSGKTTLANKLFAEMTNCLVLESDSMKCSHGTDVTGILISLVTTIAETNLSVIVDAVNLHPQDYQRWKVVGELFDKFEWVRLETPLEECIKRDSVRPYPVGEEAIHKQGQDWN